MKRTWLLVFYLLAGIIVGALLASVCAGVPALNWLAYGNTIGFNPDSPFVLDLIVLKVSFGFAMTLSVAQIITIALAIFLYTKTKIR